MEAVERGGKCHHSSDSHSSWEKNKNLKHFWFMFFGTRYPFLKHFHLAVGFIFQQESKAYDLISR